jgi:hypothetical protein
MDLRRNLKCVGAADLASLSSFCVLGEIAKTFLFSVCHALQEQAQTLLPPHEVPTVISRLTALHYE